MKNDERFADIQQLYDDYIDYLDSRESVIAKLFVLDKYNILAWCNYPNGEVGIETWLYNSEQEIEQNKCVFERLVDNGYYETTDEILKMHRVLIDSENYIKERIRMRGE